ncbi:cache domain-containing sensor histidine kinase [Paenibacillus hunanensis]|uniref:histidine kinase n=1 Tax=Paenibacillus hunanensis TaxID=539262 RepID=A0ABU1IXK7_9BACL|nr:sensor histidine kinase [Paenibacillus hunanensis]MDR6243990.1 two-component system sensor histidine kinase YesM [Paenibacillus hunanensis]GGJ15464.1 histidine kinase [Paenibacillus hunanensis]
MPRRFRSIHHRLFVLFLVCMTAILLIVTVLFYNRTTTQFHDKLGEIARKNVSQTAGLLDLLLASYDSLSKSISTNADILRLVAEKRQLPPQVEYANQHAITNMMGTIYFSRDDLVGIHIIGENGKIYDYGNYTTVADPNYASSDWYKQISASTGKMIWLGVFSHSLIDKMEDSPVFAFGRPIFDLNEQHQIGIVLFEAKADTVVDAVGNLKLGPNSQVSIVNGAGHPIAISLEPNPRPARLPEHLKLPDVPGEVAVQQDGSTLVAASKLDKIDWTIVSTTPSQDLNVELTQTKRYLLIVVTILIIVSALIALIVSRTISSPLARLVRQMKQVENGNFRGMVNVTSYEEINGLVASFNHMVRRVEELIERVKLSSVSEKNAELHALQSQVNPHFLYNTLDMIYWMLDEKGNDRLGEIVLSLSQMFRYSSHWEGKAEVMLREEVEQIRHYLTIIQMRLEDRLTVEIRIDERWMDLIVPKMLLQPVIENAVKHGLEANRGQGLLVVEAVPDEQYLNIRVSDNGAGMTAETLYNLHRSLLVPENEPQDEAAVAARGRQGIGMQNVHQRLKYMFGDEYGIGIESKPGEGTRVTLRLPLPEGTTTQYDIPQKEGDNKDAYFDYR